VEVKVIVDPSVDEEGLPVTVMVGVACETEVVFGSVPLIAKKFESAANENTAVYVPDAGALVIVQL
jgi:hypothetical protein